MLYCSKTGDDWRMADGGWRMADGGWQLTAACG
jgi:hypothetical protein